MISLQTCLVMDIALDSKGWGMNAGTNNCFNWHYCVCLHTTNGSQWSNTTNGSQWSNTCLVCNSWTLWSLMSASECFSNKNNSRPKQLCIYLYWGIVQYSFIKLTINILVLSICNIIVTHTHNTHTCMHVHDLYYTETHTHKHINNPSILPCKLHQTSLLSITMLTNCQFL